MAEDRAESLPASDVENLVIVGSGPAGYTAAIYAARANLSPLMITGFQDGGIPGGQLMTTTHVENFPGFPDGILGPDLMDRCRAQALRWGTRLVEADAESIDLSQRPFRLEAEGRTILAHAVILATGASANRLGLPQEERFWSQGISACAICIFARISALPMLRARTVKPTPRLAAAICASRSFWSPPMAPIALSIVACIPLSSMIPSSRSRSS